VPGAIVAALAVVGVAVLALREPRRPDPPPVAETRDAYLRGRYFLAKADEASLRRARESFEQATRLQPTHAAAWAGLANAHVTASALGLVPVADVRSAAAAAARRAVELDDESSEAHVALGLVLMLYEWNWEPARRALERGLDLDPRNGNGHFALGHWYTIHGRIGDAIREYRTAVELEPLSLRFNTGLCRAFLWAGRHDEAITQCRRTLELDAAFWPTRATLHSALYRAGRHDEWIAWWVESLRERGESARAEEVRTLYAREGPHAAWRWSHEWVNDPGEAGAPATPRAIAFATLGRADDALRELERAADAREPMLPMVLDRTPEFEVLRAQPRFAAVRERLRLPAHPDAPLTAARAP
jgi:tetratricopeptide (TPR) repeat protein